jgi:hypothetical protein
MLHYCATVACSDPFAPVGNNAATAAAIGTALHAASAGGHTLCVELLCQNGASVDVINAVGQTPMDVACEEGEGGSANAEAVMEILELNGAKRKIGITSNGAAVHR